MKYDRIETLGHSTIQHGKLNDRVYLMKLGPEDMPQILDRIEALAQKEGYAKVFAKVPARHLTAFRQYEYSQEASIPGYYLDNDDCLMLAKYYTRQRSAQRNKEKRRRVLEASREKTPAPAKLDTDTYTLRQLEPSDAGILADLYRTVFDSYPFAIDDPEYIRKTMKTHITYYGIFTAGKLVTASSAEKDLQNRTVEMTDFATYPEYRRRGLASALLAHMEQEELRKDARIAYTIARAASFGMNITFAKLGYTYGGTLYNNTCIGGAIESMNVWYKKLSG
ncbi:MAG: putative beta-lysine N-acetyltransferase [Candidatus Omnitrophica bacterium]|nr:putative beta-lysine N-acetyltransferase [Candidatus Omnitrophota bacterium]